MWRVPPQRHKSPTAPIQRVETRRSLVWRVLEPHDYLEGRRPRLTLLGVPLHAPQVLVAQCQFRCLVGSRCRERRCRSGHLGVKAQRGNRERSGFRRKRGPCPLSPPPRRCAVPAVPWQGRGAFALPGAAFGLPSSDPPRNRRGDADESRECAPDLKQQTNRCTRDAAQPGERASHIKLLRRNRALHSRNGEQLQPVSLSFRQAVHLRRK